MFRKISVVLVLAMVMIAFSTAALAQQPLNPLVQAMVDKAKADVKKVTAAEVKAALDAKADVIYLDVRDPDEFAGGHIPGAVNLSRGKLEFRIFTVVPKQDAKIYVYCLTAARSALATKTLNDLGYKNAVLMNASWADWVKDGYPVAR